MDSYSVVTSGCTCVPPNVFCPAHGDVRDRHETSRAPLNGPEERWTASQAPPAKPDTGRLHRTMESALKSIAEVNTELTTADATMPPPNRRTLGQRRGSERSDPALAQVDATMHAVDVGLTRLGHLADDCLVCPDRRPHNDDDVTMATLLGTVFVEVTWRNRTKTVDLLEQADQLTGLSATSPFADDLNLTTAALSAGVRRYVDLWHAAYSAGAETDTLRTMTSQLVVWTGRVRSLADAYAQWSPMRTPRAILRCPCTGAGCNHTTACPRTTDGTRMVCTACSSAQSRVRTRGA